MANQYRVKTGVKLYTQVLEQAYAGVEKIHFAGAHFRKDIGAKN